MPTSRPVNHRSPHPVIPALIRDQIDSGMRSVSDYLNGRASRMSRKALTRLLILLITCWGTACAVIILGSLLSPEMACRPGALSYPQFVPGGPSRASPHGDSELVRVGNHIARFRYYLDSLRNHAPDHYLSILHTRPGLVDSLQEIEHILSHLNQ